MKFGRKMVLVDYETSKNNFNNIKPENVSINNIVSQVNPTESVAFSLLDREMTDILNLKNISDFEKWKLYRQTLEKSLFHIRTKQQSEINEAKKFDEALSHISRGDTDPRVTVQRNIIKQMKPRTIIAKRKISSINRNIGATSKTPTSTTVARLAPPIELSSDDSLEYSTPSRLIENKRRLRTRDSKGRAKKPSKTSEAIFANWEQLGASSSHGLNFD